MNFKELASIESRKTTQWGFYWSQPNPENFLLFCSPSDVGVMRNHGRNGSRYAPQAIMNILKSRQVTCFEKGIPVPLIIEGCSVEQEWENFAKARKSTIDKFSHSILSSKANNYVHLAGGHDHIVEMAEAILQSKKNNIFILNIDAHCDTRTDSLSHSGNPFKELIDRHQKKIKLVQYGIHQSSNAPETLNYSKQHSLGVITGQQAASEPKLIKQLIQDHFEPNDQLFISLDVDALSAEKMEAVSAVNPNGLKLETIIDLIHFIKSISHNQSKTLGIYEYNPLYDNLSAKGARSIAMIVEEFLK